MRSRSKKKVSELTILLTLIGAAAWADSQARGWPAFLPPSDRFSAGLVSAVERTWADWTLSRTVRGPTVRAGFDLYTALIDSPDVTAAAARYRRVSKDEVRAMSDGLYEADDRDGSRGFYRVLSRERGRRVIFSWGENTSRLLGTIRGDALTVLTVEPRDGVIEQTLTTYVRIDNRVVAAIARALLVLFGGMADRKLSEGVVTAARVAEWASARPGEFCDWLSRSGLPATRRAPVQKAACHVAGAYGGQPASIAAPAPLRVMPRTVEWGMP